MTKKTSGKKHVILVDNMTLCLSQGRGKSFSPLLKQSLREICALTLATGCKFVTRRVPSERNPADAPSRGRPVGFGRPQSHAERPINLPVVHRVPVVPTAGCLGRCEACSDRACDVGRPGPADADVFRLARASASSRDGEGSPGAVSDGSR